jgi:hypothetical protein
VTGSPKVMLDREQIAQHVRLLHELAMPLAGHGKLIVASYGENLDTGEKLTPKIEHFAIGEVDPMTEAIVRLSSEPHRNVYAPLALMHSSLTEGRKGAEEQVVAAFGIVADFDDETACYWAKRLPLDPDYSLETSPGRFQTFYLFDQPERARSTKPVAKALQVLVHCDSGTRDVSHVWRIPGTPNWPNVKKVDAGRSHEPALVRIVKPWNCSRTNLADLAKAVAMAEEGTDRELPRRDAQAHFTASESDDRIDRLIAGLPDTLRRRIETRPSDDTDRSEETWCIVNSLWSLNRSGDDIIAILRRFPEGPAMSKYGDRLDNEVVRILEKVSAEANGEHRSDDSTADSDDVKRWHFRLRRFNDIELSTERSYLVKGLIPREALVVVWGPPKCGKSFWAFDLAMHVALGRAYRGRSVTQGAVVYIACEGEHGFTARAIAFRQTKLTDTDDPPFFLLATRLDLVAEVGRLIIEVSAQIEGQGIALIIVDTLNRSLRGSESKDEDMGAYLRAADQLRETFKSAVVVIHHCGINDRRPRGHTSLTGAADAQIAVGKLGGDRISTTVEFMKDGAQGDQTVSDLVVVEVGRDEDDEPITSCIIQPADREAPHNTPGSAKLTPDAEHALKRLAEAIDRNGEVAPASDAIPPNIRCVTEKVWRANFYHDDTRKPSAKQKAYKRAVELLIAAGRVGNADERVWVVEEDGPDTADRT